ncbi:MAG: hypothetical protein CL811_03425 [Colwelliaceae bacterium]|nr:hypothetical protein [Colwelliaceae bacterium]
MKKLGLFGCMSMLCLLATGCNSDNNDDKYIDISAPIEFNFAEQEHGFTAMFSDYPPGEETFYELVGEYADLPEEYGANKGWYLAGNNHSDDLIMAIKGSISGLRKNTLYSVSLDVEILTNTPSYCFGIGGAPGESVYVKLATATQEPANDVENEIYRINTDIGFQAQSGSEGVVVGDIANGENCFEVIESAYLEKQLSTELPIDVMSDDHGKIWLLAATDSGYEGITSIYITKLVVTITE